MEVSPFASRRAPATRVVPPGLELVGPLFSWIATAPSAVASLREAGGAPMVVGTGGFVVVASVVVGRGSVVVVVPGTGSVMPPTAGGEGSDGIVTGVATGAADKRVPRTRSSRTRKSAGGRAAASSAGDVGRMTLS